MCTDSKVLLYLLISHFEKLLLFFSVRESHGGQRLLRRADYHLGNHVNTFFRARCRLADPSSRKAAVGPIERRHVTYFGKIISSINTVLREL